MTIILSTCSVQTPWISVQVRGSPWSKGFNLTPPWFLPHSNIVGIAGIFENALGWFSTAPALADFPSEYAHTRSRSRAYTFLEIKSNENVIRSNHDQHKYYKCYIDVPGTTTLYLVLVCMYNVRYLRLIRSRARSSIHRALLCVRAFVITLNRAFYSSFIYSDHVIIDSSSRYIPTPTGPSFWKRYICTTIAPSVVRGQSLRRQITYY